MSEVPGGIERRGRSPDARRRRALFGLLGWVEHHRPTGVVRVRLDGREVGALVALDGRLCLAAPLDSPPRDSSGNDNQAASALFSIVDKARGGGFGFCATLEQEPTATRETVSSLLYEWVADGCLGMASACADQEPSLELWNARPEYDPALSWSPLEVFVNAAGRSDQAESDPARRVYDELANGSTAALLLRVAGADRLPFPVAQRGLEHARLRDIVSLARDAARLAVPDAIREAGIDPRLLVIRSADVTWVSIKTESRLALIRASNRTSGRTVARALRALG